MKYDYDLIVIGGGAAGLSVTSGAAQLGAKVLLIEKDAPTKFHPEGGLGGDCLHYGCVPSKSLIKSAKVAHFIRNSKNFGLPDFLKGKDLKLNWKDINKRIKDIQNVIQKHDSVKRFKKLGTNIMFGQARFINKHTIQLGDEHYSAKYFVIATGSRPRKPSTPGLDKVGYITNMKVFTLPKQPKSLLIVGGGPIGAEMAQAFARLGTKVYLVEKRDHVLSREDKDTAKYVMDAFEEDGVEVHTNCSLVRVSKSKSGKKIATVEKRSGKNRSKKIEVEEILIATGRQPNIEGLGLERIGITHSNLGIKTNDKCKTNIKHIYAAGDVNGKYQFTHTAGAEAGVVIANMLFKTPKKMNYNLIPWTTFTDPEVASIGINESTAKEKGIEYKVFTKSFKEQDRALAEGETKGMVKILTNKKGKLIGAQIVGPHAGELIHEFIIALNKGLKIGDIVGAIHVYPTLADLSKQTAGQYYTKKLFSNKTKKLVKFLSGVGKTRNQNP